MAPKSVPARKAPPAPVRRSAPPAPPARSVAAAPAPPKPAPAPAAAATAPAAAAAPKKARARSAPMGRAVKFIRLADEKVRRSIRLVDNWHGEASSEQQKLNASILQDLRAAAPHVEAALLAVGLLESSGFVPTEARGRAITEPPEPGDRVQVRAKHYHEGLHGSANDFEVVTTIRVNRPAQGEAPASTSIQVRIRPTGDVKAAQLVLPWGQLERIEDVEARGEDEDANDEATEDDARSLEDDDLNDDISE